MKVCPENPGRNGQRNHVAAGDQCRQLSGGFGFHGNLVTQCYHEKANYHFHLSDGEAAAS